MKKAPNIDLEELNKIKEQNFRERLEFIDKYTAWLKRSSNKGGSKQKEIID